MNNFVIHTFIDGINDPIFYSNDNPIEINAYQYNAQRMGAIPNITATLMHPDCLDDYWTKRQYIIYNNEKYFIFGTPSSSKDNISGLYNHTLQFKSERFVLENVYFFDVVVGDNSRYQTNSTNVFFYGDINEFAERLRANLAYNKLDYTVIVDDGITSESVEVSFIDIYILSALQTSFELYNIPHYFKDKEIHFGYTDNVITEVFSYGDGMVDNSLLSIQKNNANFKNVTFCTGIGSEDNIPYYYPNESEERTENWINPVTNLMPPIYRATKGAQRFYPAINDKYLLPDSTDKYYHFENQHNVSVPQQHKVDFTEIKPTIIGIENASGKLIGSITEFAYDEDDNDDFETDPESTIATYKHPYFYAKLKKFDGINGFNLFEHAIDTESMTIVMHSGNLKPASFTVGVVETSANVFKNPVQVDSNGNIVSGNYNDKVKPSNIQEEQQNTETNEVWIALRKDIDTFGVIMPNVTNDFKPEKEDQFVILGINLPQPYITAAEKRLEDAIIKYMYENNTEKFNFTIKFSRIFLQENPSILNQLNENARIAIEYNNKIITSYISNFTYKKNKDSYLPEITIIITDTITTQSGALQNSINEIKQDILSSVGSTDFLKQGLKYFLRKDIADRTRYLLSSDVGFEVGRFISGLLGEGAKLYKDSNGKTNLELDRIYVRLKAFFDTIEINKIQANSGNRIVSAANIICNAVEDREINEDGNEIIWDYYRCYFKADDGDDIIKNDFVIHDMAMTSMSSIKLSGQADFRSRYYWREVVGVGENYIDLSKSLRDLSSDDPPVVGDNIIQLGNKIDTTRQNAIEELSVGFNAPSYRLLQGINDFNLNNKSMFEIGFNGEKAFFNSYSDAWIGLKDRTAGLSINTEKNEVEVRAKLIIQGSSGGESTVEDELDSLENKNLELSEDLEDYKGIMNSNLAQINSSITGLQNTQDKMIVGHSGEDVPTLTNAPANEWNTTALLKEHEFDIYDRIEVQQDGTLKVVDSYKFMHLGDSYAWVLQSNSESAANRVLAEQAYNLAGIKATIFYKNTHPNAPYAENDVWIDVDNGVMYLAKFDRPEGQVGLESDWLAVIDAQLRLSNLANDGIISKEEKPQYRDILAQVTQEMVKFREDAETYSVDISALESAFGTFETQNISVYKVNVDSDTSVTAAQRTAYNVAFADYQTEKMHFANAIAEKITSIQIAMLNVAGENILDDSRLLKLNPYNTGRGTSVLIDNESEEAFYRSTPSSGLSVSMYTLKTFSYKDLDIQGISLGESMIDSIYVRHFHTEAVTFRAVTNAGISPIVVYPSKWTQIHFLRIATNNYQPSGLGVYNAEGTAEVVNLPIDYKKQAVRKGNLVVDWSPSIKDTFDSVNDAIDLAAEVDNKVDQLDNSINDALKDGSLDAIEKASIVEQLKVIETLFDEKESSYNIVYNNGYLEGEAKTLLHSAMADLYSRKVSLSSAINNLVNATTITDTLRLAYSTAYSNFDSAVAYYQTRLEAANKAIQTKLDALAQEHTDFLQQVISSKGDQLIENGSLLLGSNYGFPNTEFSGEAYNGSAGSLTRANTARYHIIGTQNIPLDTSKEWLLSGAFKSENGLTRSYAGLMMYDIDGTTIQAYEHMYIKDTLTTLAQPLEDGDTVVYFDDLENWIDSSFTFQRGFIFWNYTNSKGYTYPELTYSKNVWSNIYQNSGINKSMNRITLSSPWTGGTIPAGTKVSQSNNGNTYKYSLLNNTLIPTEWEDFKGVISGIDYTGTNDTLKFAPGTAFVKLFILWNWNSAADQMWATNLFLKNNAEASIEDIKEDISDIFSDGQATPDEKIRLKGRLDSVTNIHNTNKAAAEDLGIAIGMYDSAFGNLNAVLSSVLTNLEITSTADLSYIESLFADWELQNSLIVQAISEGNGVEGGSKAKEDLAIQMGYTSYEEMVQKYEQKETLIKGGRINTGLIEAEAIVAEQINTQGLVAPNIKTAVSGDRVEITQSEKGMSIYDASGTLMAKFHGQSLSAFDDHTDTFAITDQNRTFNLPLQSTSVSDIAQYTLAEFTVSNPANEVTIPAVALTIQSTILIPDEENQYAGATISIVLGGVVIGFAQMGTSVSKIETTNIPEMKLSLAAGSYTLMGVIRYDLTKQPNGAVSPSIRAQINYATQTGSVSYINKLLEIAFDGLRLASGDSTFFDILRNGLAIAMRGKGISVDLPGYLASYTVPEDGGAALVAHGAKSRTDLNIYRLSTGKYRIYHNIGHLKYTASMNAYFVSGAVRIGGILNKTNTYIEVQFEDTSSTPQDCKFDINLFGEN